jgi:hypothetical protein
VGVDGSVVTLSFAVPVLPVAVLLAAAVFVPSTMVFYLLAALFVIVVGLLVREIRMTRRLVEQLTRRPLRLLAVQASFDD